MSANYYHVLGVTKAASDEEIRAAYRSLALRYHPDKNKDPEAEERFKDIAEAYEVLSDRDKRDKYNRHGTVSEKKQERSNHNHFKTWFFHPTDPFKMFQTFFGHQDPFSFSNNSFDHLQQCSNTTCRFTAISTTVLSIN